MRLDAAARFSGRLLSYSVSQRNSNSHEYILSPIKRERGGCIMNHTFGVIGAGGGRFREHTLNERELTSVRFSVPL